MKDLAQPSSGMVLWLTGLPASGKTTLAKELRQHLTERGVAAELLDADELRKILTPHPAYTDQERDWFYGVLVYLAELLSKHGIAVLIAATAHRRAYRDEARRRLPRFAEIYVECDIETCRRRDPKGLYAAATRGEIASLPGEQVSFEVPESPEIHVDTSTLTPPAAARAVMERLVTLGVYDPHEVSP
ncbi:MAG TPA: adenylyl-sulfate kinase [Vicinamibacteria bacterium]|jgi:adenylylsulfate kinase